jgi:hypothetical protein
VENLEEVQFKKEEATWRVLYQALACNAKSNLNILASFFPLMVSCEPLHVTTPYVSACLGMP